ncbi:MAG: M20 family metallopeptidase [Thermoplasmatales archaeon]
MANYEGAEDFDFWKLALKIHDLNEIGSREFESSKLLMKILKAHGFRITEEYMNMPTAFKAEKSVGNGNPTIAFLAEYDALPGIGHACGHNLIASSAVFSAIKSTEKISNGTIIVFGTPDEEGSGEWSGSKVIMADKGAFKNVNLVLGSHPGDGWDVGSQSLAVQDVEVTFKGVAAHEAANPNDGRSALDAAVLTYNAVGMMRQHVRRDVNFVMHGIIKEGGTASNVTPERAVLTYGIRASDIDYHRKIMDRFLKIVQGCAIATETTYSVKNIGPLFSTTKINKTLSRKVRDILLARGISCPTLEETLSEQPKGSTDFANVSQVVPALEVGFQIADEGTPWHSRESLEAAKTKRAKEALAIIIDTLSDVAKEYADNNEFREGVERDFRSK